jgi:5-methylcytosine-specific restriction enzyme B
LIIDEINRGNVSKIFGELVTLIEDDKRLNEAEALKITLPYSKEPFGVPNNLYIIGTMNTADRSVEALDTALRRRFSFVEMPPKYDLEQLKREICGYSLHNILETINTRIGKLLGKDNLIGHSYFLAVKTDGELKALQRFHENEGDNYYSLIHNGIQFKQYVGVIQVGDLIIYANRFGLLK